MLIFQTAINQIKQEKKKERIKKKTKWKNTDNSKTIVSISGWGVSSKSANARTILSWRIFLRRSYSARVNDSGCFNRDICLSATSRSNPFSFAQHTLANLPAPNSSSSIYLLLNCSISTFFVIFFLESDNVTIDEVSFIVNPFDRLLDSIVSHQAFVVSIPTVKKYILIIYFIVYYVYNNVPTILRGIFAEQEPVSCSTRQW